VTLAKKSYPLIDANPTKRFFISMLVRDIELQPAIIDLVDNSVDGARASRASANGNGYKGLYVNLTLNEQLFKIEDNCGGILASHARDYVFNFGRKENFPAVEGSVGQFGVGMKRALFKLGNHFRIESTTERTHFVVDVDVAKWEQEEGHDWSFTFDQYRPRLQKAVPEDQRRTVIVVDQLNRSVAEQFKLGTLEKELALRLGEQHQASLDKGLSITVNDHNVLLRKAQLLSSSSVSPIHMRFQVEPPPPEQPDDVEDEDAEEDDRDDEPEMVDVNLYAGLSGEREESAQAGWYVFCNDRLVLGADRTGLTGWGRVGGGSVPLYHPQFRRFRGYVFMHSENASLLPWNTTKTSVDANSPVYRRVLREMIAAMQQVTALITSEDKEKETYPRGAGPIAKAIAAAQPVALAKVPENPTFKVTLPKRPPKKPETVSVQYRVERTRMEEVQDHMGGVSARAAGLAAFDYYYDSEID
jgi:hypothetical protein